MRLLGERYLNGPAACAVRLVRIVYLGYLLASFLLYAAKNPVFC